jgi:hypothetical protein
MDAYERKRASQMGIQLHNEAEYSDHKIDCIFTSLTQYFRGKFFFLLHSIQTASGSQPASYPIGTVGSFHGCKTALNEADNSPPASAEVKNGGAIPLLLPHVFMP